MIANLRNLQASDCQSWHIWRVGLPPRPASPPVASSSRQYQPARRGGLTPLPSGAALPAPLLGTGRKGPRRSWVAQAARDNFPGP
jgi:hypothetical protein